MGEDFKDVVDEKGGMNFETLKALSKSDPIKHDIALAAVTEAFEGAQAIYRLANDLEKFDSKIPIHRALGDFAFEKESEMVKKSQADQEDDHGRKFATKSDYSSMTESDRARHWTFSPDDISKLLVYETSKRAKEHIALESAKFLRQARARKLISDDEETQSSGTKKPAPRYSLREEDADDTDAETGSKPLSPSVSSSPKLAASKSGGNDSEKSGVNRFVSKLLG